MAEGKARRTNRKTTGKAGSTTAANTKGGGPLLQKLSVSVLLIITCFMAYRQSGQQTQEVSVSGGQTAVHFIDVGQGDAILIEADGGNMLIDAAENGHEEDVMNYLDAQGITKLDYVTATHPHSDHIGGMEEVMQKYEVGQVLLPQAENTSRTFENMIDEITERNIPAKAPVPGDVIDLGSAKFTVLAPNQEEYDNLNNYSIVFRMVTSGPSFIFAADAEKMSEEEMLANGLELDSDILKVGHHGSSTSSSQEFFDAVSPEAAVISLGKNNSYGHPHKEVLELLAEAAIPVYRTDENGTVVITVLGDGSYSVTTERD